MDARAVGELQAEKLGDAPSGFVPFTASDIAEHRDDGLAAGDVHEIRAGLGLD